MLSHADRVLAGRVLMVQHAVWLRQALSSWQRRRVAGYTNSNHGFLGVHAWVCVG